MGGEHQPPLAATGPVQVHLIGVDRGGPREGRPQQRSQLLHVPLAVAEGEHGAAGYGQGIDLEVAGKGGAGRDDGQIAAEKQDRGVRGRDQRQRQAIGDGGGRG